MQILLYLNIRSMPIFSNLRFYQWLILHVWSNVCRNLSFSDDIFMCANTPTHVYTYMRVHNLMCNQQKSHEKRQPRHNKFVRILYEVIAVWCVIFSGSYSSLCTVISENFQCLFQRQNGTQIKIKTPLEILCIDAPI